MKKLVTSFVLLSVIGSGNVIASNISDGFNWPAGFSSSRNTVQQFTAEGSTGFVWPDGSALEGESKVTVHSNIAYGLNWPEGS